MKTFESEIKYKIIAKNAMTMDTKKLTIYVLLMKSRFPRNNTKEGFIFFYRDVTVFHEVPLTPLVFRYANSRKTL